MKPVRLLSGVSVVLCLALLSGCGKKEGESAEESGSNAQSSAQAPAQAADDSPQGGSDVTSGTKTVLAKDALASWEAGRKDEAVTQFLSVQWDSPSAFEGMEALTMSEQDFRALSQSEMTQAAKQAMDLTGKLRKLIFYVASDAEKLAASGNTQAAKERLMAVKRHGQALSQPERLEIVQMYGEAAAAYADKKLSAIK